MERNVVLPDYIEEYLPDYLSSDTTDTTSGRQSVASSCFETELDIDEFENGVFDDKLVEGESRMAYITACEYLGVVPVKRFLDELNDAEVYITHRNLRVNGSKALSSGLVVNTTVKVLDLSSNMIGDKGAKYIISAIIVKDHIENLKLSNNYLSSDSALMFAEYLQRSKTITKLELSANHFIDNDAFVFAESLKNNKVLRELDLSHNQFTKKAGIAFGDVLTYNTTLRSLNLGWNQLSSTGVAALAKGMAENEMLQSLDLSWNGVDSTGACAIASSLEDNVQLKDLKLAYNRISDKGLTNVVNCLAKCRLQTLDLSRNLFLNPTEAIERLLKLLIQHQTDLREVDLGQTQLSNEAIQMLDQLNTIHPRVNFHYGYKTNQCYEAIVPKPINAHSLLLRYAKTRCLPVLKFFQMLGNTDIFHESIPSSDFENGLRSLNILNEDQIKEVVTSLDPQKNAMIDYINFKTILETTNERQ